jgi:hypothetical protein
MRRSDLVTDMRRLRASHMALNALLAWRGVTVRALRTFDLVSKYPCLTDNTALLLISEPANCTFIRLFH